MNYTKRANAASKYHIFLCLLLSATNLHAARGNELTNLPLRDETYAILKRFAVKYRLSDLSTTLPLSRRTIAEKIIELSRAVEVGDVHLTPIEQNHLDRLRWLFSNEIEVLQRQRQEESIRQTAAPSNQAPVELKRKKYLLSTQGEYYRFDFDPRVTQEYAVFKGGQSTHSQTQTGLESTTSITSLDLVLRGKLGQSFGFADVVHTRFLKGSDRYNPYSDVSPQSLGGIEAFNSMVGYILYRLPWLTIELGRDELWWGPGQHGALILSDNAAPKDLIKISGQYDWIGFTAFTARLNEPAETRTPKYLSAHRLEITPLTGVRFGLDEAVVYANRFEASYLNPVIIYFITEPGIVDSPDNRFLGMDFDLTRIPHFEFYGELMIDDFQPQMGFDAFRSARTKFGLLMGGYWVDPLRLEDTDLRIEYAFINQFAYTHKTPETGYLHSGRIIGHWLGPDAEDLWISLQHWFTPKIRTRLVYERERHGEGDITKPLPPSGVKNGSHLLRPDKWEYLSGVVETTHTITLGVSLHVIGRYLLDVEYAFLRRKNIDNQINVNSNDGRFLLKARYQF